MTTERGGGGSEEREVETPRFGLFRLEDEPPRGASSPVAARYWRDFYRDLIGVEEQALRRMRQLAEPRPPALQEAVRRSNIEPMEEFIDYLRDRLGHWERRLREAEASERDISDC